MEIPTLELEIDLTKDGLPMLFRPYQVITLDKVWKASKDDPIGSREMWDHVNRRLREIDGTMDEGDVLLQIGPEMRAKSISRASIINFLNYVVDVGILDYVETTGKGGYRKLYFPVLSVEEMWVRLAHTIIKKFIEASGNITLFDGKWEDLI